MQNRRDRGEERPERAAAGGKGFAASAGPPTDWRVVADGDEAKHAVGGDWDLHLGKGSLNGRRDEWWVTVEKAGEPVLDRERLVVGAGSSPWSAVADLLDEYR